MNRLFHKPAMVDKVLSFLITKKDGLYVDGTLGGAGHTEAILKTTNAKVIAFDIDPEAIKYSKKILEKYSSRVKILNENFANIKSSLKKLGVEKITGLLLDLGISSYQIDEGGGFSFRFDEELDMRMDRKSSFKAYDVVNFYPESKLADVISKYGEERKAKAIAREIVKARRKKKIKTTAELVEVIDRVVDKRFRLKSLARVFQAIRIEVNKELENLKKALEDSVELIEKGGRIVVISYHSLEDRIVKNFFRLEQSVCVCPPEFPECRCGKVQRLKVLTKKPVTPDEDEIKQNPRVRSAKLRCAEKII